MLPRALPTTPDGEQTYHAAVMAELMRLAERSQGGPEVIDAQYIERQLEAPSVFTRRVVPMTRRPMHDYADRGGIGCSGQ